MKVLVGGKIESNFEGFSRLIEVYDELKTYDFEDIEIDMSLVDWFDANMCSPFGALLHKISHNVNNVSLVRVQSKIESVLSKNKFLSYYGRSPKVDTWGTTVEFKHFDEKDESYFGHYIEESLVGKGLPTMTKVLMRKFRESLFEIFSNAIIHSGTNLGIFSCGQYFPAKKRFDFSITDLGIGFKENIKHKARLDLTPVEAISWAVDGRNTTKTGPIPGGLGLKLLKEFIEMNKGRIQIASDSGYWLLYNGVVSTKVLPHPFPGTVVNVEINTADRKSYRLSSEIDPDDIF